MVMHLCCSSWEVKRRLRLLVAAWCGGMGGVSESQDTDLWLRRVFDESVSCDTGADLVRLCETGRLLRLRDTTSVTFSLLCNTSKELQNSNNIYKQIKLVFLWTIGHSRYNNKDPYLGLASPPLPVLFWPLLPNTKGSRIRTSNLGW